MCKVKAPRYDSCPAPAVVTVGFIGEDKPRVSYATAMDVYIIICFAFVFCALTEFAFIHFLETYVRRVKIKVDK